MGSMEKLELVTTADQCDIVVKGELDEDGELEIFINNNYIYQAFNNETLASSADSFPKAQ